MLASALEVSLDKQRELAATQEKPEARDAAKDSPAENLFAKVRELLLQFLEDPKREAEVVSALEVTSNQARTWLNRLTEEGVVERRPKPVSYVAKPETYRTR